MILADFSLNNFQIKSYFEGTGTYTPVSELLYIHTHPLIKPNFVDEIESLVNRTAIHIETKKVRGSVIEKFTNLAIKLGAELPSLTQENAPTVLSHLRDIYKLCNSLLKNN